MRNRGLLLLASAALIFAGAALNVLPSHSLWGGVFALVVGTLAIANRDAEVEVEKKADAAAKRPAAPTAKPPGAERPVAPRSREPLDYAVPESAPLPASELVLMELESEPQQPSEEEEAPLLVSSDVSFPVELQERLSLAEQIERLRRLRAEGAISEEEFAIAKAKLLG